MFLSSPAVVFQYNLAFTTSVALTDSTGSAGRTKGHRIHICPMTFPSCHAHRRYALCENCLG